MSAPCVSVAAKCGSNISKNFRNLLPLQCSSIRKVREISARGGALIKINCNFLRDDEVAGFSVCKKKKEFSVIRFKGKRRWGGKEKR